MGWHQRTGPESRREVSADGSSSAMTTNRNLAGGRDRRAFASRSWQRSPGLALLALAGFAMIQSGCRSGGCYDCNLGAKISNGVQALTARVTKHFEGCGAGVFGASGTECGCGAGETFVDSGTPVISGGIVYPAPGTIVPPPALEQPPTQLEPIQSSSSNQPVGAKGAANPASGRGSASGANPSSYSTIVPKGTVAQRRGTDVYRALHSSPENSGSTDLLDNLPPVDLSTEVMKAASTAPKPAAAPPAAAGPSASPAPTASTAPSAVPAATPAPAQDTNPPPPAEKVSAVEGAVGILPPIPTTALNQAPGIRHYASVAPSTAGGSAPSIDGLEWLKEKGYRTFVDLRKPSEVDPNFVEAVSDRNMVYISLPILANRLEQNRLARFDDLMTLSENRPLYFCDADGTRAGLVWYIHLRAVVQEDSQSATAKAEEIGLTDAEVRLAEAYLTANPPKARVSTARVALATSPEPRPTEPAPTPTPAVAPEPPPVVEAPRSALPGGSDQVPAKLDPAPAPVPATEATPSMLPGEDRPQAANTDAERFRDPAFWRPIAAFVMASIGVPLAYWSHSAFTFSRSTRVRASLPGAVLPPSETPAGSDA